MRFPLEIHTYIHHCPVYNQAVMPHLESGEEELPGGELQEAHSGVSDRELQEHDQVLKGGREGEGGREHLARGGNRQKVGIAEFRGEMNRHVSTS